MDTRITQPGGKANGKGVFQILELPIGKPVNLMACGKIVVPGSGIQPPERRRYCGFAKGTAKETREEEADPEQAHMVWKPPSARSSNVRPSARSMHATPEFRLVLASWSRTQTSTATRRTAKVRWFAVAEKGLLVSGATILLVDLDTGEAADRCVTGSDGSCELSTTENTEYALTVFAEGFDSANFFVRRAGSQAEFRTPEGDWHVATALPVRAAAGLAEQTAEANASSLLTNMESIVRWSFDRQLILKLPLGLNRSVDRLALLTPGVYPAPETWSQDGPGVAPGLGTAGQFSVNGLRSRENNFTVDGADNNDEDTGVRRQGFVALLPQPVNSVQEFQIITALPDARFGRTTGGQVNIVSDAGGADWHGSVYGFFAHSRLSNRDPFDYDQKQYGGSASQLIPITTDGTLSGRTVRFDLRQPGPIRVVNGEGFQSNPSGNKNPLTQFRQGFILAGPVRKEKTFVALSIERTSARSSRETHFSVPTVRERGLFGSGDSGLTLLQSTTFGGTPQLGASRPANESGNLIFSLYPFPNNPLGPYGPNTFTEILPADSDVKVYSTRVDHNTRLFGFASDITVRGSRTDDSSVSPAVGGALFSTIAPGARTTSAAAVISTTLKSTLANSFRFSFGTTRGRFDERRNSFLRPSEVYPDEPFLLNAPLVRNMTRPGESPHYSDAAPPPPIGFPSDPERTLRVLGEVQVAGYSSVGLDAERFPYRKNQKTFQWADTLTWIRGRHTLYFGFDERLLLFDNWQERNRRPLAVFGGLRRAPFASDAAQHPAASPLDFAAVGIPTGLFQSYGGSGDYGLGLRKTQIDLFIQDSWRINQNLQVNAGLRIEFNRLPKGLDASLARAFEPAFQETAANAATARCLQVINSSSCRTIADSFLSVFSRDLRNLFAGDRVGNDPRVGLAWRPFAGRDTVFRAGAGILTGQFPAVILNESRNAFPNSVNLNFARYDNTGLSDGLGRISARFGATEAERVGAFAGSLLAGITSRNLSFNTVQPAAGIKNPYSAHIFASLTQRVGASAAVQIAYVGTGARKLLRVVTPEGGFLRDVIASDSLTFRSGDKPDNLTSLDTTYGIKLYQFSVAPVLRRKLFEGTANSSFHSLQTDLTGRYRNQHVYRIAVTYGHAIDDSSDFFDTASGPALPQNSFARSERGSASFDARLRIVAHWVGTVVDGKRHRRLGMWEVSAIGVAQSGRPYTINSVYDWNGDGNLTDRLDNTTGLVAHSGTGGTLLSLAPGASSFDLLVPNTATVYPYRLRDGSVGRNSFVGHRLINVDIVLTQTWKVRERWRIAFRTEVYNVMNRAQYGVPVRFLEAPAFGRSVSTIASPRNVQLGLEIGF